MNLYDPKFTIGQAAAITGISANTIRTRLRREHLTLGNDDKRSEGTTLPRLVSGATIVAIAIMDHLVRLGLSAETAGKAANGFAHVGDRDPLTGEEREPGELWSDGLSVMVITPSGFMETLNVAPTDAYSTIFNGRVFGHGPRSGHIIELNSIVTPILSGIETTSRP